MKKSVPKNITILYEGSLHILLFPEWLFGEYPLPEGISQVASGIRYGELWKEEIKQRWKRTNVYITYQSEKFQPHLSVSDDHVDAGGIIKDAARLGHDLYEHRRHEWLVPSGSEEYKRIDALYMPKTPKLTLVAPESHGKMRADVTPEQLQAVEQGRVGAKSNE